MCGLLLGAVSGLLPKNFQKRRRDAISDRSLLKCLIGMLCNGRTDFTDINQYQDDTVFANAFEVERLPSESLLRQRLDELPPERKSLHLSLEIQPQIEIASKMGIEIRFHPKKLMGFIKKLHIDLGGQLSYGFRLKITWGLSWEKALPIPS